MLLSQRAAPFATRNAKSKKILDLPAGGAAKAYLLGYLLGYNLRSLDSFLNTRPKYSRYSS